MNKYLYKIVLISVSMIAFLNFPVKLYAESSSCEVIRSHQNSDMKIALTFDDGPHVQYTEIILDILDKYNVKATFFIIGENAKRLPELVCKIKNKGHEIANHTFTHRNIDLMNLTQVKNEMIQTEQMLNEICGANPKLFRPPGGINNNILREAASALDYRIVMWSVDTRDWSCYTTADMVVDNVIANTCTGSIILLHDSVSRSCSITAESLERILDYLLAEGYNLVTVSELLSTS